MRGNQVRGTSFALGVAAAIAAALPSAALGQSATAAADEGPLVEIVVTAQKRSQNVQDVPISVSVLTADVVSARGGTNVESLAAIVPSLTYNKQNTSLNNSLFLRGVGTNSFALISQPSVAYVLDGVVLSSSGEGFASMYDVERIEVLKGPQGTLFGKNSSAGVVNVVSKKPGKDFGGSLNLAYGEDEEIQARAAVDVPLSDNIRTRTTFFWGNFPGYVDNVSTRVSRDKANGYHQKGVRSIGVIDATDKLTLTVIGDYSKSDDNCCAYVVGTQPAATGVGPAAREALQGITFAGADTRVIRQDKEARQYQTSSGVSLQADYDLGPATLTSISAWRKWDVTELREGDWTDLQATLVGLPQIRDLGPQSNKTLSQELRITSPSGGTFEWVGGLYWSKLEAERYFQRDVTLCSASTAPLDSFGARPCGVAGFTSTVLNGSANATMTGYITSFAGFGDVTWKVRDDLRLIAGLRWTQDKTGYFHVRNPTTVAGLPGIRTDRSDFGDSNKASDTSGRAGIQYDWTPTLMTYATYSRGYKGPTYNVFFNMTAANRPVILAETGDSYEIGVKSELFGNTVFNAAAFWAKYKNFQSNVPAVLNGTVITTITNVGDITTGGVEVEFRTRVTDALNVSGGFAYDEARFDALGPNTITTAPAKVGSALPFAPKFKGSLSADYTLRFGGFSVVPSVTYSWQSASFSGLNEPAAQRIKGYGLLDAQIAVTDANERFRIALVGHNMLDDSYTARIEPGGGNLGNAFLYQLPRDVSRYWSVQARYNFGGK